MDDCLRLGWTCENGGQAVDTGKSCECQCADGFTGEHCQTGLLYTTNFSRLNLYTFEEEAMLMISLESPVTKVLDDIFALQT